eukprot:348586-Rhodomonas_salina.8
MRACDRAGGLVVGAVGAFGARGCDPSSSLPPLDRQHPAAAWRLGGRLQVWLPGRSSLDPEP